MDKLILSNLKHGFNDRVFNDAFVAYLSEKQKLILQNIITASDIKEVSKLQGQWQILEKLKSIRDEIKGADHG